MKQDEIIEMASHIASTFGTRMCDENGDTLDEELYAMNIDDIIDTIKLVDAKATAKEREACAKDCEDIDSSIDYYDERVELVCAEVIRARGTHETK